MPRVQISQDLKKFIREQIHSVYTLETLLLLHRNQEKTFSADDVARELGFESGVAYEQLSRLVTLQLVARNDSDKGNFKYLPANGELARLVDRLALAYSKHRVPILSLILGERSNRIRLFAEAFRVIRGSD